MQTTHGWRRIFWPSSGQTAPAAAPERVTLAARVLLAVLKGYKLLLSPLFSGCCRFHPSCADYSAQAIRQHGALRGAWLTTRRLSRCRPLGGHGFDPVPHA
jgi:putative membrane protein insertion efficiency factor